MVDSEQVLREMTHPTGIGKTKNGKKLHLLLTIKGQKRLLCRPYGTYELYEIANKSFEDIDCEDCRRIDISNKHFGWY